MNSLLWTVAVYTGTVLVAWRLQLLTLRTSHDRRILCAVFLLLAGAHSTAVRTGAEDVAANPVVLETAMRGLLDLLALLAVVPLLVRPAWRRTGRGNLGALLLVSYVAVAGISTLYSSAPVVTAAKTFELFAGLAVVVAAMGDEPHATVERLRDFVRTVVLLEAGLLVTALFGFFLMPHVFSQFEGRVGFVLSQTLTSPYASSNGLSSVGAVVSAFAFAHLLTGFAGSRRRVWVVLGCAGVLGIVLSSGRQGVAMWVASMAVLLWVCRRRWLIVLVAPTAVGLAVTYRDLITAVLSRGQASVTLATWSGRLDFWAAAVDVWKQHPWLGFGFGVGGRFVALASIGEDAISSLHSGYMEALTGVGVLGLIPLGLAIGLLVVWTIRCLRAGQQVAMAILIVPLLLHTLVSTGFGGWLNADLLVFAALVMAAGEDRRSGQRPASASAEPRELAEHRLA